MLLAFVIFCGVVGLIVFLYALRRGAHNAAEEGTHSGRELFAHACGVCHTLAAVKSVGRTGPNLDYLVGKEVTSTAARRSLVLHTIAEGQAFGLGNMPAELYVGKEAEDVAKFVAAVAGR